jgi:hypothetical protein
MDSYDEILQEFVFRLKQKAMAEMMLTHEGMQEMEGKLGEIEKRINKLGLDAEAKTLLDDNISVYNTLAGFREEAIYIQGAKDCVLLLKELGILP